jgi:hypothetical protein
MLPDDYPPHVPVATLAIPRADESLSAKLDYAMRAALLAPSGHNAQPWVLRVGERTVEVFGDRRRSLPIVDPEDRELAIGCGGALAHLELALRACGIEPETTCAPNREWPDLLARVRVGQPIEPDSAAYELIRYAPYRHTNRFPFAEGSLLGVLRARLSEVADSDGVALRWIELQGEREQVVDLVARGDRLQLQDPLFRRELASWIRSNRSDSKDGMRAGSFGVGDLASILAPAVIRHIDRGPQQARRDRELAMGAPALCLLHTSKDDSLAWIETGRRLAHLLLAATGAGYSASFFNAPIEVPELRAELAAVTCGAERSPQLLFRLGVVQQPAPPEPRRPLEEVVRED